MASNPIAAAVEVEGLLDERTRELLARRRRLTVRRRGWLVRRALLLADVIGLVVAFALAELLSNDPNAPVDRFGPQTEALLFFASLPAWIVVAKLYGLYVRDEERADHSTADDLVGVFHLVTVGTWGFYAFAWLTGIAHPQLARMAIFWMLAIVAIATARAGARAICRRQVEYVQNTVVIGTGETARLVARKLRGHPELGLNLVGFVGGDVSELGADLAPVAHLGRTEELHRLIDALDVERVVVACPERPTQQTLKVIRDLKTTVQVDIVPHYFQLIGTAHAVHALEGLPLLSMPPQRLPRSSIVLKRSLDVVVSSIGLVALAPFFAVIAAAIKLDSPGPVWFRQTRMGAGDRTFRIVKFRTMVGDADARKAEVAHLNAHALRGDGRMFKVPNDPRVTRVGRFLRRFSLDELPQLWNVLRGEMSLVGPRPLILDEDSEVREWGRRRLQLRPGMTGLWQVLGTNNAIGFDEMVNLDYLYVTTWSLWTDVRLLIRTLPAVVRPRATY